MVGKHNTAVLYQEGLTAIFKLNTLYKYYFYIVTVIIKSNITGINYDIF